MTFLWDAAVVGAGPAGSMAACAVAERGYRVLIIERKHRVGEPVRCGELIRRVSLARFVDPEGPFVKRRFSRYDVTSPRGAVASFVEQDLGRMIDRAAFDRHLAAAACAAGAMLMTETNVEAVERDGTHFAVRTIHAGLRRLILARTLIVADGVASRIARLVGFKTATSLRGTAAAAFATLHVEGIERRPALLRFGSDITPGGYGWVFPISEAAANIGVGLDASRAREGAAAALVHFARLVAPAGQLSGVRAGAIPIGRSLARATSDGVIAVGDAARRANPLTGAGIGPALASGRLGGQILAEQLDRGDISAAALARYDLAWQAEHGAFHTRSLAVRRYLDRIDDTALDRAIVALPREAAHASVAEDLASMVRTTEARGYLQRSNAFNRSNVFTGTAS